MAESFRGLSTVVEAKSELNWIVQQPDGSLEPMFETSSATTEQSSHVEKPKAGEVQDKVLACDLFLEWHRVHEPMKGLTSDEAMRVKRDRFIANVETFPMEAYGLGVRPFQPYTMDRSEGQLTLRVEGYQEPIREVYNPHNENHPWPDYRLQGINYQRALVEYDTFRRFEESEMLANAREGDSFIWISMPPMEILEDTTLTQEQKKKQLTDLGYGSHTNTFVLTVENGMLQGRVVKDFLGREDHRKLLHEVTGEEVFLHTPTELEMLSVIKPVKSGLSVTDIRDRVHDMYQQTPENDRIKPFSEEEDVDYAMKEEYMFNLLRQVRPMLEQAFYLLHHTSEQDLYNADIRALIDERINEWQNALGALFNGQEVALAAMQALSSEESEQLATFELSQRRGSSYDYGSTFATIFDHYTLTTELLTQIQQERAQMAAFAYQTPVTGCGEGSGWGTGLLSYTTSAQSNSPSLYTFSMSSSPSYSPVESTAGSILPLTYGGAETVRSTSNLPEVVRINCPGCNEKHAYNVSKIKAANRLICANSSCGNSTDCWEPIVAAAARQSNTIYN